MQLNIYSDDIKVIPKVNESILNARGLSKEEEVTVLKSRGFFYWKYITDNRVRTLSILRKTDFIAIAAGWGPSP